MLCYMSADLEMNWELMAVTIDPVFKTLLSIDRVAPSRGESHLLRFRRRQCSLSIFASGKATACSVCRPGVNFWKEQSRRDPQRRGFFFSFLTCLRLLTWEF